MQNITAENLIREKVTNHLMALQNYVIKMLPTKTSSNVLEVHFCATFKKQIQAFSIKLKEGDFSFSVKADEQWLSNFRDTSLTGNSIEREARAVVFNRGAAAHLSSLKNSRGAANF